MKTTPRALRLAACLTLTLSLVLVAVPVAADDADAEEGLTSRADRLRPAAAPSAADDDGDDRTRPSTTFEDGGVDLSYQERRCFTDPTGDTENLTTEQAEEFPRADITEHCGDFEESELTVSLTVDEPTDPETDPNWDSVDTAIVWFFDTNFEPSVFEYTVEFFIDQASGDLVAAVFDEEGMNTCEVTPVFDGTQYMATGIEPLCIGFPQHVQMFTGILYDADPGDDASAVYLDVAPNEGCCTEEVTQTNGLFECALYGQFTDEIDLIRNHCPGGPTEPISQAIAVSHVSFGGWNTPDGAAHVVIARNDVFADTLTGSALSFGIGPILFTHSPESAAAAGANPNVLAPETRVELQRVLVPDTENFSTVYLLGGTQAISPGVEEELRALGYNPVRLSGPTRFETAVAIAREVRRVVRDVFGAQPVRYPDEPIAGDRPDANACPGDPGFDEDAFPQDAFPDINAVILAYAFNWPDAVAAGSLAAYWGMPILLTDTNDLPQPTLQALRELDPQCVYPAGGTAVISDDVLRRVVFEVGPADTVPPYVVRKSGSERTGTAIELSRFMRQLLERHGSNNVPGQPPTEEAFALAVNIRRDDAWAHILAASAITGRFTGVFLPLEAADGSIITEPVRTFACEKPVDLIAIGGTDLLAQGSAETLRGHLAGQGCPA